MLYQISSLYVKPFGCRYGGRKSLGDVGASPLGMGMWLPLGRCFSPSVLSCQIWSFQVKPFERNYADPPENFDPVTLNLSRSLTDRSATYDFLLVFRRKMDLFLIPFPR